MISGTQQQTNSVKMPRGKNLREEVSKDVLRLFTSHPGSEVEALPALLVSGMPEWYVQHTNDRCVLNWFCRQLRTAILERETRMVALRVILRNDYHHSLALRLEAILRNDESLTLDIVWHDGEWQRSSPAA